MKNEINVDEKNKKKSFVKILLMGKTGVGKTSIKSIIFQQQLAKDTLKLAPSIEIEEMHSKLLGNININLMDCCSKDEYVKKYFTTKKEKIFSKVNILIFVVDASNTKDKESSLDYFKK